MGETRRTSQLTRDPASVVVSRPRTTVTSSSSAAPAPQRTPSAARPTVQRASLLTLTVPLSENSDALPTPRVVSNGFPSPTPTLTDHQSTPANSPASKQVLFHP